MSVSLNGLAFSPPGRTWSPLSLLRLPALLLLLLPLLLLGSFTNLRFSPLLAMVLAAMEALAACSA
jgi:hypothetical protein